MLVMSTQNSEDVILPTNPTQGSLYKYLNP